MDFIVNFFDFIQYMWNEGIVSLIESAIKYWVKSFIYGTVKFALWSVPFMWEVAQEILIETQISQHMSSSWSALDGEAANLVYGLKVPEAINIILTAFVTKFGLRVMGW